MYYPLLRFCFLIPVNTHKQTQKGSNQSGINAIWEQMIKLENAGLRASRKIFWALGSIACVADETKPRTAIYKRQSEAIIKRSGNTRGVGTSFWSLIRRRTIQRFSFVCNAGYISQRSQNFADLRCQLYV